MSKQKEYEEYEETCWKCRGKGVLIKTSSIFKKNRLSKDEDIEYKPCTRCNGLGYKVKKRVKK